MMTSPTWHFAAAEARAGLRGEVRRSAART